MGEARQIDLSVPLLLAGIVGMLLLGMSLIGFFIVYQRRLLHQQRLRQAEETRHQRELLSAAVEVQENERRRIAGDLHDDIGSLLSAARLYLKQLVPEQPRSERIKTETLGILDSMITNARRITHDLMPAELDKFGFFAAAQDLFGRLDAAGGPRFVYESCPERRLLPKVEVALYRVLQELTSNTLRHAAATRVRFDCEWRNDVLLLTYSDDGRGFETARSRERNGSGLGLRNIETRVTLVGGSVETVSAPGQGIKVTISLPHPTE